MKDNNVILELSRKDAECLEDFLDGLYFYTNGFIKSSNTLIVTGRIIVMRDNFYSTDHLNTWCRRLNNMLSQAKIKAIADKTDPILP